MSTGKTRRGAAKNHFPIRKGKKFANCMKKDLLAKFRKDKSLIVV
jgi:hypothetical protein